jgi:hypothetical protein
MTVAIYCHGTPELAFLEADGLWHCWGCNQIVKVAW